MSKKLSEQFESVKRTMFDENQRALPEEDRLGYPMCLGGGGGYKCTKVAGHAGDHCAHGSLGTVLVRWQ